MNFLNIFEDHVAGIFGAARAPFSFKKLAKQAAHEMEDQTLVVNGTNTAPALYTILVAADDSIRFSRRITSSLRTKSVISLRRRQKRNAISLWASPSSAS